MCSTMGPQRWAGGATCRVGGRTSVASWRSGSASLLAYQVARGITDRDPARAFTNGFRVVRLETHLTNRLYELTFQQFVDQRHWLAQLVSWTYWNSEFTVVGLALLWVYMRRHEAFVRFRNSILLANVIGLLGYVLMPMAPPRMLGVGFVDDPPRRPDPARRQPVRGDAEPARVRRADRRDRAREPGLPPLVGEGVLDRLAGLGLVRRDGDRQPLLARLPRRDRRRDRDGRRLHATSVSRRSAARQPLAVERQRPWYGPGSEQSGRDQAGLHDRRAGAGASRSIGGLARTRVTPNALTATGVLLCAAASIVVLFENRHELTFYWLGAVCLRRRLGARHPRRRARPRGRQDDPVRRLPRLDDRPGRRGVHARRDRAMSSRATATNGFVVVTFAAVAGSFLVSYTALEGRGARAEGRRRHRLARRARRRDHRRPRLRPVGRPPVGDRRPDRDRLDHGRAADSLCAPAQHSYRAD